MEEDTLVRNMKVQCQRIILQLKVTLRHFPKDERYALTNEIRLQALEILKKIIECEKKFFKKTTQTELDIAHETLRELIFTADALGYFAYFNNRQDLEKRPKTESMRIYLNLNNMINDLGVLIGAWIKKENKNNKYK